MYFSLYRTASVGCQPVIAQCKASWRLHKMSERLWLRAKRSEVFWAKISQSNHIFKRDLWLWFSSQIMIVNPVCKNVKEAKRAWRKRPGTTRSSSSLSHFHKHLQIDFVVLPPVLAGSGRVDTGRSIHERRNLQADRGPNGPKNPSAEGSDSDHQTWPGSPRA